MGSSDLFKALTQNLPGGRAAALARDDIQLTPGLSVVVAILYMMAVDGEISDRESSQLQSVIGADQDTLHRAVMYVDKHDISQFLEAVPSVLDAKTRLCLLLNVCDSLMADGRLSPVEIDLFDRLLAALGHTKASFQPYYDAIALKDMTSVLGEFNAAPGNGLTPPMILVASLLYMMSADGSMSEEEIGRLNAVAGISQPLLKASLRYVSQVRAPQFLSLAAGMLTEPQRLCVLLNACDTMMSDRVVASAELQLFQRMLAAFGVEAKGFDKYLSILRLKNEIPQDDKLQRAAGKRKTSSENTVHAPARAPSRRPEGQIFERKRTYEEEGGEAGKAEGQEGRSARRATRGDESGPVLKSVISNTMQDNKDRLANQFDQGIQLKAVSKNARARRAPAGAADNQDGPNDRRALRDAEGAAGSHRPDGGSGAHRDRRIEDADGLSDRRGMRDADGVAGTHRSGNDSGAHRDRRLEDAEGLSDRRGMRDADGHAGTDRSGAGAGAHRDRHLQDADGLSDRRGMRDADGLEGTDRSASGSGAHRDRHMGDADGLSDRRGMNDADGSASHRSGTGSGAHRDRHMGDADGLSDRRGMNDAEGDGRQRPASGNDAQEGRHWQDAAGPGDRRDLRDADGSSDEHSATDAGPHSGRHWEDADGPADLHAMSDAGMQQPGRNLIDDRDAFDDLPDDELDGPWLEKELADRALAISQRTQDIQTYLEAMLSTKSIAAACRLRPLPAVPVQGPTPPSACIAISKTETAVEPAFETAIEPAGEKSVDAGIDDSADAVIETSINKSIGVSTDISNDKSIDTSINTSIETSETQPVNAWDDGQHMLLASDEGGPIMTQSQSAPPASAEEARQNRKLRQWSAVLLPALFLTYGTTLIGESTAERTFITNENMATDARIVHQMTSVQQTVYRVAPEAITKPAELMRAMAVQGVAGASATSTTVASPSGESASGANSPQLSDREKADRFLEQRKEELSAMFQRHQGASAIAAERQQWFMYAQSIVLLGLGMAFWGVLYRSMRMLHASTAAGIIGLLLTINGYWLLI